MVLKHALDFITEIDENLELGVILTEENLSFSASTSHTLADGTFNFCPRHFTNRRHFMVERMGILSPIAR